MHFGSIIKRNLFQLRRKKQNQWKDLSSKTFWTQENQDKWDYKNVEISFPE